MKCDILIKGGQVFDGSGAQPQMLDVAIHDERIVAMGKDLDLVSSQTLDARGLVVCPGFIDIKTHSDFTLPINPKAESKVRQGVTTEIIGHCGFSVAPCLPDKVKLLADYLNPSAPWLPFKEMNFKTYVETFPQTSVNVGMLVGHNTLRLMAMGMEQREPSFMEMSHMKDMLTEGLKAGAIGMSSGLFTSPGSYAAADELKILAEVLASHGAAYFTHLRDESSGVLEALAEAIDIGRSSRIHVQVVHFKCSGVDNWGKTREALDMMDQARLEGIQIDCDAYPYTAGSNPLKNILPQWVQAGGVEAMIERLKEPPSRQRIRQEIEKEGLNNWGRIPSWEAVRISITPHQPEHAGKTIAELARLQNLDPIDALCEFLIKDKGATRVLITSIAESDIVALMGSERVLVGSDGNCVADYGVVSQGMPHPRFYGTFPRVLGRYVHRERVTSLTHAIHKMTGATAQALGFKDRGLLKLGWYGDVTMFEPEVFLDLSTYENPHRYPQGDRTTVIVNGTLVVDKAKHTGALPGRVLQRVNTGSLNA